MRRTPRMVTRMKQLIISILAFLSLSATSVADDAVKENTMNPSVKIETSLGDIIVELNAEKAPLTVKNFLGYVEDKFYDGTVFHRVIRDFMIQGGGMTADLSNRLLASVGELSHPPAENQYGDQRHGDSNQNHQAELEIGDHHERQRTRERESVAHRQAD